MYFFLNKKKTGKQRDKEAQRIECNRRCVRKKGCTIWIVHENGFCELVHENPALQNIQEWKDLTNEEWMAKTFAKPKEKTYLEFDGNIMGNVKATKNCDNEADAKFRYTSLLPVYNPKVW